MMLTGWQMKNGVYYYMNGDGKMQTGWLLYNNTWYYLSESGAMVTAECSQDGRTSTDRSTTCIRMDIRRSMK